MVAIVSHVPVAGSFRHPAFAKPVQGGARVGRGDHDLNPDLAPRSGMPFRPAAVLIPIVARSTLTVLLTRRSAHLREHGGQIAFPGGRIESHDAGPIDAALREANEEVGISPTHITPLGFLDTYHTATGFSIAPLVGLVEPSFSPVIDPSEVDEAFEVPLAYLMDAANQCQHVRRWNDIDRRYYAITWNGYYIWGATAGMLVNLRERLFEL